MWNFNVIILIGSFKMAAKRGRGFGKSVYYHETVILIL